MVNSDNESGGKNNDNAAAQELASREQDRFLPIANVSRLMKKALSSNAKISKEAKQTMQQCVSEFVSFVTSEASFKCKQEKRKTITGEDLLWSMATLGFKEYAEVLKVYLQRFREMEGEKGGSSSHLQRDGRNGRAAMGDNGVGSQMDGGNGGASMGDNDVGSYMMMGQNMYGTQQQPYYQQQQQQRPFYYQHQQQQQPYYQHQQQQHQPPYYPQQQQKQQQQQQQQQQAPHYQQQQKKQQQQLLQQLRDHQYQGMPQ